MDGVLKDAIKECVKKHITPYYRANKIAKDASKNVIRDVVVYFYGREKERIDDAVGMASYPLEKGDNGVMAVAAWLDTEIRVDVKERLGTLEL